MYQISILGASMGSPGDHFGSSWQPRCAQKTPKSTQKTPKWANLVQLGSNLEAQSPPNPSQTQPKTLPDPLSQQLWRFCRPFQHWHRFSFDFLILKSLKPEKYAIWRPPRIGWSFEYPLRPNLFTFDPLNLEIDFETDSEFEFQKKRQY